VDTWSPLTGWRARGRTRTCAHVPCRYYNSVQAAVYCKAVRKVDLIGTVQANRVGLPSEWRETDLRSRMEKDLQWGGARCWVTSFEVSVGKRAQLYALAWRDKVRMVVVARLTPRLAWRTACRLHADDDQAVHV
jgi:hypothetical protein